MPLTFPARAFSEMIGHVYEGYPLEACGLLVGTVERPGADLGEIGEILRRVTARHTERMTRMGLTA